MNLFVLLLLLTISTLCDSKTASGDLKLSGTDSEIILTKFALSPKAKGSLDLKLVSKDMYEDESTLKVHLFLDTKWDQFKKARTCAEKVQLAHLTKGVQFDYDEYQQWRAKVETALDNVREERPHYFYVVIDDCSLEYRNPHAYKVPTMHFELEIYNAIPINKKNKGLTLTHLSADETGMKSLHTVTLVVSLLLTCFMGLRIGMLLVDNPSSSHNKHHTVHLALLLVMAASGCDAVASLCELLHLNVYERNGYGSYTLDAMSSHFEAICDSLVAILLLSIAAGWTLPSDVVAISSGNSDNNWFQSLICGLRSPIGSMMNRSIAGYLALAIIAVHAILAQWGRTFNDDFDSYHDLEHAPGRVLMLFRTLLGLLLMGSCFQTAQHVTNTHLQQFYSKLALVGLLWFESLPFVTWFCSWMLPYYQRHPAVATGAALVQSTSLVALAWLVTAHSNASSYHTLSRLGQEGDGGTFTDQLATSTGAQNRAPSTWKIGKTKIRLD